MSNRPFRSTSKEGEAFITPHKPNHKQKIVLGLERLRIGGTHEEAAAVSGLRPDQAWKRMSELERDGTIFNTGITRKLKSGVNGIVWQLVGSKAVNIASNPTTTKQQKAANILRQINLYTR